jgi:lysozyme family protein
MRGVSAFFSRCEGWHRDLFKNSIWGTKERPKDNPTRAFAVPSDEEVKLMQETADPVLGAAIAIMAWGGLRVSGLVNLSIMGDKWTTETKGKTQEGRIPAEARAAIPKAGLPLRSPFSSLTTAKIQDRFRYLS